MTTREPAAAAWAEALAEWAIPAAILGAAPEEPWRFPPALFEWTRAQGAAESIVNTPSRRRAIDAIPAGGSVLDVGVGGGRASLALVPPAASVVGVDPSRELLASFAAAAAREGVAARPVLGKWPDVVGQVEPQDVVVCHHVAYNVADLVPFARALTDHARYRVVLELTAEHPTSNLNEAWRVIHGVERPSRPTASDAVAVLEEMGLLVTAEAHQRQLGPVRPVRADVVAFARRRLCVGAERDPDIDRLLGPDFDSPLRDVVTVWWEGRAHV